MSSGYKYRSGQLQIIKNKKTDISYFIFLGVGGIKDTKAISIVIPGIKSSLTKLYESKVFVEDHFVSEVSRIEEYFPNARSTKVYEFPITIFYDEQKNAFKESLFLLGMRNLLGGRDTFFPMQRTGAIATENSFFDREEEIEKIWQLLKEGKNVILRAPRRSGKTSLVYYLKDKPHKNYQTIYIDVMDLSPEKVILETIINLLLKQKIESKPLNLPKIEGLKTSVEIQEYKESLMSSKIDWYSVGDKVFQEFNRLNHQTLFLIEELPDMLDSLFEKDKKEAHQKVIEFLSWLTNIRKKEGCQFLFSSSRDISLYLKDKKLPDFFNDCVFFTLKPLPEESARVLTEALLYREGIYPSSESIDKIIKLSSPAVPYFLQVFIGEVIAFIRNKNKLPDPMEIENIYHEQVTGSDCRRYFDSFAFHPRNYGSGRELGARRILDRLAVEGRLSKKDLELIYRTATGTIEDFEIIISLLKDDLYIEANKEGYEFSNPILKDYWRKFQVR